MALETWQNYRTLLSHMGHQQQITVHPGLRTDFGTYSASFGGVYLTRGVEGVTAHVVCGLLY